MTRRVIEDRPDRAAIEDLRTSVVDLADAVAERGLDRAERVARARQAAEASEHVATVARLLDPYRDGKHCRLQDRGITISPLMGPGARQEAEDRLVRGDLAMQVPAGFLVQHPSPFGGQTVALDVFDRVATSTPWLSTFAQVVPFTPANETVAPTPWTGLPTVQIDPEDLTPTGYEIPGDPLTWTTAAVNFAMSAQVLHWTAAALETERATQLAMFMGLEAALIARLVTAAVPALDFEAAESATGAAWPGGAADLVLTSSTDLPKVRRLYAAELPAADYRPRVMAAHGVPVGTALVMPAAAVDVRRTPYELMLAPGPSTLGLEVSAAFYGSVELLHPGVVASVDLTAGA